eukprot:UN02210
MSQSSITPIISLFIILLVIINCHTSSILVSAQSTPSSETNSNITNSKHPTSSPYHYTELQDEQQELIHHSLQQETPSVDDSSDDPVIIYGYVDEVIGEDYINYIFDDEGRQYISNYTN